MRRLDEERTTGISDRGDGGAATILIVDDQESNLRLLERVLTNAGYSSFVSTSDPLKAVDLYVQYRPDLVVLDLHMPQLDGLGVLERLNAHVPADAYVPVLVLTGDLSPTSKQRALSAGAKDFLGKPFDPLEVVLRIKNLLEARSLYVTLQRQNDVLEDKVAQRRIELEDAQLEILERLGRTAEFRDDDTMQHTQRVGAISARIAEVLGLPSTLARTLRLAAPLHDIGKIGVPDNILLKLGKLTEQEYDVIKTHTTIGARILSGSSHLLLQMAEQIAQTHHERWDGNGYLTGLKGEDIPLVSRIVAVADVFDALTHQRPYKDPWPVDEALKEIESQSGLQFDPDVVAALRQVVEEEQQARETAEEGPRGREIVPKA
jgi:putative two-component system response regulator